MPPNILLITADDMNWDALGAFGCPNANTTPHLDQLAAEGMRFDHAHVTISVCQPSRSAMMTGRYPHHSGGEGFFHLRKPGIPLLPECLRNAGYRVGILGKYGHSTPYESFRWDEEKDIHDLGHGRNPKIYANYAHAFIENTAEAQKPFFLMLNIHDPHRPFYGNDPREWYQDTDPCPALTPSKIFHEDEITVPGFLEDLPEVRKEVAEYYSSVRRGDDTIGAVLKVLRETNLEENTLVVFLSDNGMAFPFAKTNCYLNSTKTPFLMKWPGHIPPGSSCNDHMISGIDLMPTLLEAAGAPLPDHMDGYSFLPLLHGNRQAEREQVFTQFHQTAGKMNYPIRCVQNRRFGYMFNAWSNGEREFRNESQSGRTMKAMCEAAETHPEIAARVNLFLYRQVEELYDFDNDPHARKNLIEDPAYREILWELQAQLEQWMIEHADPALTAFRNRSDPDALAAYMQQQVQELGGTI
ncbi:sulfatase [Kiritimatiellaeota bacterium B1221]|nr:sulfatase [Kiritimatiellaeota bacterium B1221]